MECHGSYHILPSILWYYWSTFLKGQLWPAILSFMYNHLSIRAPAQLGLWAHTLAHTAESQVVNLPDSLPVIQKKQLRNALQGSGNRTRTSQFVRQITSFLVLQISNHKTSITIINLVGGWPTPLKNMKVSWNDDYSQWKQTCSKPPASNHHHYPLVI